MSKRTPEKRPPDPPRKSIVENAKNGRSFNTLAQLRKVAQKPSKNATSKNAPNEHPEDDLKLKSCTTSNDKRVLKKRAKRNYFTTKLARELVDASIKNPDSSLKKSYWNTYHCCNVLKLHKDDRVTGDYCKTRWCLVCNAIRTAKLIRDYQPTLDTWENKCFVTLTRKSITDKELSTTIDQMQKVFNQIKDTIYRRYKKGKSKPLVGLRKLECNYNPTTKTYNPHYHLILSDIEVGKVFIQEWRKRYSKEIVNEIAQDIRPADDNSSIELFKYFTKVITKTQKKLPNGKVVSEYNVFVEAMDVIFNAIKGRRTFQPFGFKKPKPEEEEAPQIEEGESSIERITKLVWIQDLADWANEDTGELLSGFIPDETLKKIVKGIRTDKQLNLKFE